ncbi:DEAD/DEAH box helicase [bacterium]|nr:DEAD/DEAH box helicase [bacterium]
MKNEKKSLINKMKHIDEQIELLQKLKAQYQAQIDVLNSNSTGNPQPHSANNRSYDRIESFHSFFRGRENVYARLWVNQRSHKKGYSPACKNEWVPALCKKPNVKCSICSNQAFLAFDNTAIERHLSGKDVIGIYPMTEDEKCFFLAFDFDKECWLQDINALRESCFDEGIDIRVERSRSGKGGHGWIFFEEAVPAYLARQLGAFLITKTMSSRFEIDMKSYDRMFPNQDILPKGGFGNLIALPFQKEAMLQGNSMFIDKEGNHYDDQWGYLSSTKRLTFAKLREIVSAGLADRSIMEVRFTPTEEKAEDLWSRLPSGKRRFETEIKNLPKKIEAILSNRIYIKTDQIPAALVNKLRHLAVFQNPEFYKKQKMRFSTHATPRVICCAEFEDGYLSIPRGCLEDTRMLLQKYKVDLQINDKRNQGKHIDCNFLGSLNAGQTLALNDILSKECGIFVAPPGSGKTILAIAAIAKRKTNTLILVHRKLLMEQWRLRLSSFLGIDKKEIGLIGGGKSKYSGLIDIAMVQSMDGKDGVDDHMEDYGFVIVDECHHVSAFSFEKVLNQAKAKYILGLTATPYRRDGHQAIIHMQCGAIVHRVKQKDATAHISHSRVIPRVTQFECEWNENSKLNDVLIKLVADQERNRLIIRDIINVLDEGRFPLVITERREHLEYLAAALKNDVDLLAVMHGGLRKKMRESLVKAIRNVADGDRALILATGSYIGEGYDVPRLDTLFLTMPSSFKGKIVQYAGRLHRYHRNKDDIQIYDYIDMNVSVLERMAKKRRNTYKMLGYSIDGYAEA